MDTETDKDMPESIAAGIISELINVVIESQAVDLEPGVIDNEKIFSNIQTIHKQVFVKVAPTGNKLGPLISSKKITTPGFGTSAATTSDKAFPSNKGFRKKTMQPGAYNSFRP